VRGECTVRATPGGGDGAALGPPQACGARADPCPVLRLAATGWAVRCVAARSQGARPHVLIQPLPVSLTFDGMPGPVGRLLAFTASHRNFSSSSGLPAAGVPGAFGPRRESSSSSSK
jgi:hypothetical protein